ncbi:MAG: CPBP family intramembrane metalloprotease [Candidatus Obscuribacterales bacterium]|nr:CPBP family intramembrane metalloprotease [Candidatus Obscuribacterales bacterium]
MPSSQTNLSKNQIFNLIILIEALVLILATAWSWLAKIELLTVFSKVDPLQMAAGLGTGFLLSLTSIATARLALALRDKFKFFDIYLELINDVMAPVFSKFLFRDIVLIALASGFCEEVFYRGVLQNQFGILIASIVFGLCHFAGKRYLFYAIWAALAGALFGYMIILTGSLWPPILAHITNNFVSLTYLRYRHKADEA